MIGSKKYKSAVDELYHDYGKGDNKYPGDITGVTEFLNGRRGGSKAKDKEDDRRDSLVTSFVQSARHTVRCYNCQRMETQCKGLQWSIDHGVGGCCD